MATLPIGGVIGAAFKRVFSHPKQVFAVGLPYFVLLFILGLVSGLVLPPVPEMYSGIHWVLALVFLAIQLLIYTAMLVAWHRVTLLGYGADKGMFRVGLGPREWRFLGYSLLVYPLGIGLGLIVYLAGTLGGVVGLIVGIAAVCAGVFLILRYCLVLPATAADHPTSLETSWKQTADHFWAMLAVFVVLVIIFFVVGFVVALILGLVFAAFGFIGTIIILLVMTPLQLLATFVSVSALSYIYRALSGHPNPLTETP
jgi:hypothetical protein